MPKVLVYRTPSGSVPYREFLQSVRRSGDAKALRNLQETIDKLAEHGFVLMNSSMMDNIEDAIYELRTGPYRVLCFHDRRSDVFLLLNGFRKRTQKTPESQKARARALANQYLDSIGR